MADHPILSNTGTRLAVIATPALSGTRDRGGEPRGVFPVRAVDDPRVGLRVSGRRSDRREGTGVGGVRAGEGELCADCCETLRMVIRSMGFH